MANFYNLDRINNVIIEEDPEYIILQGGRNIGKSYQVKKKLLEDSYVNGTELIYLRREQVDIKTDLAQGYWSDMNIREITEDTWDSIIVYQGKIFWARHDDEGKICEKQQFGWVHALSLASHYKSVMFPKVSDIIFEEFIPDNKPYLQNEPLQLQEYVSTIFRTRKGRCWLIGNTLTKLNPYVDAWKLEGINKMKPKQIDIYRSTVQVQTENGVETHTVKTAVQYCAASGLLSKMAFGAGSNQIVTNEYRRFEQPKVSADFVNNLCHVVYTMYMFYQNLKFKMDFCEIDDSCELGQSRRYFWYVKPAASKITIDDLEDTRVISNEVDMNPLHTGLNPISPKEKRLFDYFAKNKVFFCDDMTGTDWKQCFQALMRR